VAAPARHLDAAQRGPLLGRHRLQLGAPGRADEQHLARADDRRGVERVVGRGGADEEPGEEQRRRGRKAACAGLALAAALLLATPPMQAAATLPQAMPPLELRYAVRLYGLDLAEAALKVEPGPGATRSELRIESQGLLALLRRSVTRMAAQSLTDGADAAPQRFDLQERKPDRYREALVRWAADGAVAEASEVKNGRKRPSEVPEAKQARTVDPLTALLRLRHWLADPVTGVGAATVERVFDGRKRYDLEARRLPDGRHGGAPAHRIEARLVPVFGFDAKDRYVSWPGEPERWFEVLVASDGSYMPLAIQDDGAPIIELTRDCRRQPGCP
jgi:hypothetical protein